MSCNHKTSPLLRSQQSPNHTANPALPPQCPQQHISTASPDLSRSLTRSCGKPRKITHSPNPPRLRIRSFNAIRLTTVRASGGAEEDWDWGWCLGKMKAREGRATYIRFCSRLWVPGALKHGKRNNVPQRTGMREGKRKTENGRLIRVSCTMCTICRSEKPSDWIAGLVEKEEREWHLKDKDVVKSSRVWGKLWLRMWWEYGNGNADKTERES